MGMSPAYQRGAAEVLPDAVTFDRFHVRQLVGGPLDDGRRREHKQRPELRRSRDVWFTSPANLSARQGQPLERLSATKLRAANAGCR